MIIKSVLKHFVKMKTELSLMLLAIFIGVSASS